MSTQWPLEFLADARSLGTMKVLGFVPVPFDLGCQNCGGSGLIHAWYVKGDPTPWMPNNQIFHYDDETKLFYLGEMKSAPCPVCSGNKKDVWLIDNCGLDEKDLGIRIDQFKPTFGKIEARNLGNKLLGMVPSPKGFATFYGDYGVGKSMMLKSLVNGFRVAGVTSSYVRMSDCLADVRDQFDSGARAAEAVLEKYRAIRVLAIDEVDRVNWTEWAKEAAFRILDGRYDKSYCQLTILASNTEPNRFGEVLGYLASRIKSGEMAKIEGGDMRVVEKMQSRKDYE